MRIITSKRFNKKMLKQTKKIQTEFKKRIKLFVVDQNNPILNNHRLHGKWSKYRSINITGDIRIIYVQEDNIVRFIDIGSHSELYS